MRAFIKSLIRLTGFELRRVVRSDSAPGAPNRPIAKIESFLEDIRARGFHVNLILDIGANTGLWTRMAKKIFPEAAFLMVEPQPEMRASLNSVCSEYRLFGDSCGSF